MKVTIKVEGLFDNGEGHGYRRHVLDVPEFKEYETNIRDTFNSRGIANNFPVNTPSCTTTIESQVMEYIDENVNFLNVFSDMYTCIDYEVVKIKSKSVKKQNKISAEDVDIITSSLDVPAIHVDNLNLKLSLAYIFSRIENKEFQKSFCNDVQAAYIEMKDVLKGISVDKQILILFKSVGIGYMASTNTLENLLQYSKDAKEVLSKKTHLDISFYSQHLEGAKTIEERKDITRKFLGEGSDSEKIV